VWGAHSEQRLTTALVAAALLAAAVGCGEKDEPAVTTPSTSVPTVPTTPTTTPTTAAPPAPKAQTP
jgi:hypothetical protein